jgi:hypothetical protein
MRGTASVRRIAFGDENVNMNENKGYENNGNISDNTMNAENAIFHDTARGC